MSNIVTVDTGLTEIHEPAGAPDAGSPAWITVRPDIRRGAAVAADLLVALGKDLTWHGKGRNENEDVMLAKAWIAAIRVVALVVVNAQEAPLPTLDVLRGIAAACGIDLWLLHRAPIDDRTHRKIIKMSTRTATLEAVPPHTARPHAVYPAGPVVDVPEAAFPTFRAALVREPRHAPALALYDQELNAGVDAINRGASPTDTITKAVLRAVHDAPHDGELVSRLTALQVLAWRHDQFLGIDFERLLNSVDRPRSKTLELEQRLLAYRQPQRMIVTALTRRGVPLSTIDTLRVCDANSNGELQQTDCDISESRDLRVAVNAQRLLRITQGALPSDRLFVPDAKTLARFVNDAATDLGANAGGRRVERNLDSRTWLSRLGIALRTL